MVVPAYTSAPAVFLGLFAHRNAAATQWSAPVAPGGGSADRECRPLMITVLIPKRFERFPVEGQRGVERAFRGGDPVAGRHAVRHKAADKPGLRGGRGLRQRRRGRNHRIQKRQRQRRAAATQNRPAGNVLFRDKHDCSFAPV